MAPNEARRLSGWLSVVTATTIAAGSVWLNEVDGDVHPLFWLLVPLALGCSIAAVAFAGTARSVPLLVVGGLLVLATVVWTGIAWLTWALSDLTF